MIYFLPAKPHHIDMIDAQTAQAGEKAFNAHVTDELVKTSLALSCFIDGLCVGIGGIRPVWTGRAAAWALLSHSARPAMLAIARKLDFVLSTHPANRIEMTVRSDFLPGCRLASYLGFARETPEPMQHFYPDGAAAYLFARVKP